VNEALQRRQQQTERPTIVPMVLYHDCIAYYDLHIRRHDVLNDSNEYTEPAAAELRSFSARLSVHVAVLHSTEYNAQGLMYYHQPTAH